MSYGYSPPLPNQRLMLSVYLAHIKLGDGSRLAHWAKVRYSCELAQDLLRQHLLHPQLPDDLMLAAHQACEDLRARLPRGCSWEAAQAQAIRVLPVALRVLGVLCIPALHTQNAGEAS